MLDTSRNKTNKTTDNDFMDMVYRVEVAKVSSNLETELCLFFDDSEEEFDEIDFSF